MKRPVAMAGALLALVICESAGALEPDQFRCFKSAGEPQPIRLEFVVSDGRRNASYVIYEHGRGRVPVDFAGEQTLAGGRAGRTRSKAAGAKRARVRAVNT